MTNKTQAETIFAQLGGTRLLAMMTGAKNFSFGTTPQNETYVTFRIGRNSKRVNVVKVTLNHNDTYTTEFMWATAKKITQKATFSGVYGDMLQDIFESSTGMYLSFVPTTPGDVKSADRQASLFAG